jgi:hypothetical protein
MFVTQEASKNAPYDWKNNQSREEIMLKNEKKGLLKPY